MKRSSWLMAGAVAGGLALVVLVLGSGAPSGNAQSPFKRYAAMVAADGVVVAPTSTATVTATSTSTATATATATTSPPPTPSGGTASSLQAHVNAAGAATFRAEYRIASHSSSDVDVVTAWSQPPRKRETIAPRQGITDGTAIHTGSVIYVCEPSTCRQHSPSSQQAATAFAGPWWTARAAQSLLGPGASVTTAPSRTVLGVATQCFTVVSGTGAPELCVHPTSGVLLYYRTGTPGGNGFEITTLAYQSTVADADFTPPYPIQ